MVNLNSIPGSRQSGGARRHELRAVAVADEFHPRLPLALRLLARREPQPVRREVGPQMLRVIVRPVGRLTSGRAARRQRTNPVMFSFQLSPDGLVDAALFEMCERRLALQIRKRLRRTDRCGGQRGLPLRIVPEAPQRETEEDTECSLDSSSFHYFPHVRCGSHCPA